MKRLFPFFALTLVTAAVCQASPVIIDLPGNLSFDAWDDMTSGNYAIVPGFGRTGPWEIPMDSKIGFEETLDLTGDAILQKTGNGTGPSGGFTPGNGGPYPAAASVYFSGHDDVNTSSPTANLGGSVALSDSTPLPALKTLVLQLEIGEADGLTLFNDELPVLYINGTINANGTVSGGTPYGPALYSGISNREQVGEFTPPGETEPVPIFRNTLGYQWDVDVAIPITNFYISWSQVSHSQLYQMQLDQSDVAIGYSVVSEPPVTVIISPSSTPGERELRFASEVGLNYQVRFVNALGDVWQDFGAPLAGTGGTLVVPIGSATPETRYFQVVY